MFSTYNMLNNSNKCRNKWEILDNYFEETLRNEIIDESVRIGE